MRILLVSATELEIPSFLHSKNMDVLITGVGIPSTIYNLTKKLLAKDYDLAIQAGIAGSFPNKIDLGEVVAVRKDYFADIGVEENNAFKNIFEIKLADENRFPFKKGSLINSSKILLKSSLKKVNAVTLNKISDSEIQKKQLLQLFKPDAESMEGAAFHFVCLQQKIPFIQIRGISNEVGQRDKTKWKMELAIDSLKTELKKIIDTIL